MKQRFLAFGIHLSLSLTVLSLFSTLVLLAWYPSPLLDVQGGVNVMAILLSVDVILGPLMTLILFKPGKKGLKFDLTVVALFQISAFLYGAHAIYSEHPLYLVFAVDRFQVITPSQIDLTELKVPELKRAFWQRPLPVSIAPPDDPKERKEILFSTMLSGGKDYPELPKFYRPYPTSLSDMAEHALDLNALQQRTAQGRAQIQALLQAHNMTANQILAFPITGKALDMTVLVAKSDGHLLGMVPVDPWVGRKKHRSGTTPSATAGQS
jgi:hypothetical protein